MDREKCKDIIEKVVCDRKKADVLERLIHKNTEDKNEYIRNLYQIIGDIMSDIPLKTIAQNIKEHKIGWANPIYDKTKQRIQEHNDYLVRPLEIQQGLYQCHKCKSWETMSFGKQTRSADEGTSTFSRCIKCGNSWMISG